MSRKPLIVLLAAGVFVCSAAAEDDANKPTLGKPTKITSVAHVGLKDKALAWISGIHLSSDGRYLVYARNEGKPAGDGEDFKQIVKWLGQPVEMVLRDLKTDKDVTLPVGKPPRMFSLMLQVAPFSHDAKTLVMPKVLSLEQSQVMGPPRPKEMTLLTYDISTRKATETGYRRAVTLGSLGPKGKKLLLMGNQTARLRGELPEIRLGDADGKNLKQLSVAGLPGTFSPDGRWVSILQPPYTPKVPRHAKRLPPRLLLYNIEKSRTTHLPLHKDAKNAGPIRGGVWLADGKYFVYADVDTYMDKPGLHQQEKTRYVARLWDVEAAKVAVDVPNFLPVGTGPRDTVLVGRRTTEGGRSLGKGKGIWLYDVKTRKTVQVGDDELLLLSAAGGKVAYGVVGESDISLHVAKVKMPAK